MELFVCSHVQNGIQYNIYSDQQIMENQQKYALAWKFWPCQCSTNYVRNM